VGVGRDVDRVAAVAAARDRNPTRTSGAFYRAFTSERARALAVGLDWSKVPTWQSD
jgi:predicted metal-dependent phosphotriesterase family hydrolase